MAGRIAIGVVAIAVLCSGCSGSERFPGDAAAKDNVPCTAAKNWVRRDLRPVSQPVVASCDLVLYDASHGLRVVALDGADGHTAWQVTSTASSVTPGVTPSLAVVDGVVVTFAPADDAERAKIVGVDARSGAVRWRSAAGAFSGWPAPCPEDANVVCVTDEDATTGHTSLMRLRASTGEKLASPVISDAPGRDLGPGLFDTGSRDPEQLAAVADGVVSWQRNLAEIFPMAGLSSDNGWNFDRVPSARLFVGSVSGRPVSQSANTALLDLSRSMTAGISITNGQTEWRDSGSEYDCEILPCPGANILTGQPPTLGLRLRGTGTIRITFSPQRATFSRGAHIALEGFDLATGRTRWSVNAGQDLALVENETPTRVGATVIVLPDAAGRVRTVNLLTGATAALSAHTPLWCQAPTTYKVSTPYRAANGRTTSTYQGNSAIHACDVRGRRLAQQPTRAPAFVGATIDKIVAWSDTNQVAAAVNTH